MENTKNFFINGTLLTITAFSMKIIGTLFNIYISNKVSSEAVGLFNLVMSIYFFAITLATSGLSLTCTCIVSEHFSKGNFSKGLNAVKKCLLFSLLLGFGSSFIILIFSNIISEILLKSMVSCIPIYLICIGLPFISISSVINGYFSAIRKSYKSAISQVLELLIKIFVSIFLLNFYPNKNIESICICLILGDIISEVCSCSLLLILYKKEQPKYRELSRSSTTLKSILKMTIPVSITSYLRSGLSTLKQFLIPSRLVLFGLPYSIALSEYGKINGMTMSILLFPNVFFMSFSGLLIPEIASLYAKQYKKRILEICQKAFLTTSIFSICISIILFLFSNEISVAIFQNLECTKYIKILSPLILFMYLDNIFDSILKGLNKQFNVMFCNILDLVLTISALYFLLPTYGLIGYLLCIMISEIFNFCISYYYIYKEIKFEISHFLTFIYFLFMFIGIYEIFKLM